MSRDEKLAALRATLDHYHTCAAKADTVVSRSHFERLANDAAREVVLFLTAAPE